MKYQRTERSQSDAKRLNPREQQLFREAVAAINAAYEQRGDAAIPAWPASLRIRQLSGHPGIYELTWSFSGPDGRATFDYVEIEGEVGIRWRRIGGHRIFDKP